MSRVYAGGSTTFIQAPLTINSGVLSVSTQSYFTGTVDANDYCVLQLEDETASDVYFRMTMNGAGGPGNGEYNIRTTNGGSGSGPNLHSTIVPPTNVWQHFGATQYNDGDAQEIYMNGVLDASGTITTTAVDLTQISIGYEGDSSPGDSFDGRLAEIGVWNVRLNAGEWKALGEGRSPATIRPQNLVFYAPLIRILQDEKGGLTLSQANTTVGEHYPTVDAGSQFAYIESATTNSQTLTGSITPSGLLVQETAVSPTGAIAPTGATVKGTLITPTGTITPSGALASVLAFFQTLIGSITPSGLMSRETAVSPSGAITPTGSTVQGVSTTPTGGITPTGALASVLAFFKTLIGSIAPSGATVRETAVSPSGSIAPSGLLSSALSLFRTLIGSIVPSGSAIKETAVSPSGTITPSGATIAIKSFIMAISGVLTPVGAIGKEVATVLGGLVPSSGTAIKNTSISFLGSIVPSGALTAVRSFIISLAGSLSPSGELQKTISVALSGAIPLTGALISSVSVLLSGTIVPSGALTAVLGGFVLIASKFKGMRRGMFKGMS